MEIPLQFFKVAVFLECESLAATGYVVDQTPQLKNLPDAPRLGAMGEGNDGDAPPPGPFRTFQVPIGDIAALNGSGPGTGDHPRPDANRNGTTERAVI